MHKITHAKMRNIISLLTKKQPMKQMSGCEQHDFENNKYTYGKQLACVTCLLQKKQFKIKKTSTDQGINKNHKNVVIKSIIMN